MRERIINKRNSLGNQHRYDTTNMFSQPHSQHKIKKIFNNHSLDVTNCQIFFDHHKKSRYIKKIVDHYFDPQQQKSNYFQQRKNKMPTINHIQSTQNKITNRRQRHSIKLTNKSFIELQSKYNHQQEQIMTVDPNEINCTSKISVDNHQMINNMASNYSYPPTNQLPPIHQVDDIQDYLVDKSHLFDYSNFTTIASQLTTQKQSRVLIFQNDIFKIYLILKNGKPKYRIKQYKPTGYELLRRENLLKKYQIASIWKEDIHSNRILISSLVLPIKDYLYKIISYEQSNNTVYRISPKLFYKKLFMDNNLQLINLICSICEILKKVQNKIINNKINIGNIFLSNSKPIIAQWGYSHFIQQLNPKNNTHSLEPILRSKNQWFVTPEYLSPQILEILTFDQKQNKQDEKNITLVTSSSDIWSLGCTLFQIITLVPLWSTYKCYIKDKPKFFRKGLMAVQGRNLRMIKQKQKKLQKNMKKCLSSEFQNGFINPKIIQVIIKMVEYIPNQRITLSQIVQKLK